MAWIESHQELRNHPKLIELASILQGKPAHLAGHLHFLWWWCMDYAIDGDLLKYNERQISSAAGWDGDPHLFIEAMISSGFLDKNGDSLQIHDWREFCGAIVEKRLSRKEERRKTASEKIRKNPFLAESRPTVPNQTLPNQTKPTTLAQAPTRFSVPNPDEVTAYASSISYRLSGEQFVDYYASRGWKVGNVAMKDWKAAVRTWKRRHFEENPNAPNGGKGVFSPSALVKAKREAERLRNESSQREISSGI